MKGILLILGVFVLGVILGRFASIDLMALASDYTMWILYALMFIVGLSIGHDKEKLGVLLRPDPIMLLLPLGTIIGSLIGATMVAQFISQHSLTDSLAVASGLGYYSLSSLLIKELRGEELATIGLVANIARELMAIMFAPLIVRFFGPLALISAGGATTMDTTMPVIARYSGDKYILPAILHGILLDLSIPVLVPFFCSI